MMDKKNEKIEKEVAIHSDMNPGRDDDNLRGFIWLMGLPEDFSANDFSQKYARSITNHNAFYKDLKYLKSCHVDPVDGREILSQQLHLWEGAVAPGWLVDTEEDEVEDIDLNTQEKNELDVLSDENIGGVGSRNESIHCFDQFYKKINNLLLKQRYLTVVVKNKKAISDGECIFFRKHLLKLKSMFLELSDDESQIFQNQMELLEAFETKILPETKNITATKANDTSAKEINRIEPNDTSAKEINRIEPKKYSIEEQIKWYIILLEKRVFNSEINSSDQPIIKKLKDILLQAKQNNIRSPRYTHGELVLKQAQSQLNKIEKQNGLTKIIYTPSGGGIKRR